MVQACIVDNSAAADALSERWGLPARVGEVGFDVRYHEVKLQVTVDGAIGLSLAASDPTPLGGDDVSFSTTVSMAHTPRGTRLVQLDTDMVADRAERLRVQHVSLDASRLGAHPSIVIAHAVSASVTRGALTLQRLRYVCKPDVLAFTGTESVVGHQSSST
jgi:hypothetical protein